MFGMLATRIVVSGEAAVKVASALATFVRNAAWVFYDHIEDKYPKN